MSTYNFTISPFTFTEKSTSAVHSKTMISGGTMTITPNSGYVVSASNFTQSGTLPSQFSSISFADSGVAGAVGNTVVVTFEFALTFDMSKGLDTIKLPISGNATLLDNKRFVNFNINFVDDTSVNLNAVSTIDSVGSVTKTGPTTTVSGVKTTNLSSSNIEAGVLTQIGTLKVTANDSPDYNFTSPPILEFKNIPEGAISLRLSSVTRRTGEDNSVKTWDYKIFFISDINLDQSVGAKVLVSYSPIAAKVSTKEIKQVTFGQTEIHINGGKRKIKIIGDALAEFDLSVTKNSDNTSIMDTTKSIGDLTITSVIHNVNGLVNGINKTLPKRNTNDSFSVFEFEQEFPNDSSNEAYHINITPKNGTVLNSKLSQSMPQAVINQYINPTITLTTDNTTSGFAYTVTTNPTIAHKGRPNKRPDQLSFMREIVDFFSFTYVYTKGGSGTSFSTADTPTWDSSDLSSSTTTSDWIESVSSHGNEIEIFNIAIALSDTNTVATVTGDVAIKKFGTADVTLNLDSSRFLLVT